LKGISVIYPLFAILLLATGTVAGKNTHEPEHRNRIRFTENKGQWDNRAAFYTPLPGGHLYVENQAMHFIFHNEQDIRQALKHPRVFADDLKSYTVRFHSVRVTFAGSSSTASANGESPGSEYYNYFIGDDPRFWKSGVKSYEQVTLRRLYPGIDAVLYGADHGGAKYDFIVQPGSDPSQIRMLYEGQESVQVKNGTLEITTSVNKWIEQKPYAYQRINGREVSVDCVFRKDGNTISFGIGSYDPSLPLVIDPELIFSTYSGSTVNNFGHTATYDKDGHLYAAGISTIASTIPNGRYPVTPGAYQQVWGGGAGSWPQPSFPCDITVSKYTPDGSALVYATYLGGNLNDYPHSIVTDKYNNLVIFGTTLSKNFPTTPGAYDRSHSNSFDIIVSKLSADGTQLLGSTFVGGANADGINVADSLRMNYSDEFRGEVIIDNANDIIIATSTSSLDFPVTTGAFQGGYSGRQDGCIFRLDSNLRSLKASTFIGGPDNDAIYSLDTDPAGNIYFAGGTQSTTFPVTANTHLGAYKGGFSDGFAGRLTPQLSSMLSLRYWGSNDYDQIHFIRLDPSGNPVVFGQNYDSIPVINAAYRKSRSSLFITKFKPAMDSILFSTVIGNSSQRNALPPSAFMVDECGVIYGSVWGGGTNINGNFGQTHKPIFVSNTANMPLTPDAIQSTTDNSDFYLFALSRNADSLVYGTYFGEAGIADHVDGGTSRFDKKGIIYQSVCASCTRGSSGAFPTTAGSFSPTNISPDCSNASFKLDFRKSNVVTAQFDYSPKKFCLDSYIVVTYTNKSYNGRQHYWYVNGALKDTSRHLTDTVFANRSYAIKLVEVDSSRCVISDSITRSFSTGVQAQASFTVVRDSCSPNVTFTNTSTPASTPVRWYFGNGDTSSAHTVRRTFPANGTYQVLLVTYPGTLCSDSAVYNLVYDSIGHLVKASFTRPDSTGCEPKRVTLFNTSNKIDSARWYINDTLVSSRFVLDTALAKGTYEIRLVAVDTQTCNKSDSMAYTVTVFPEVFPSYTFVQDACSLRVQFTNTTPLQPGDTVMYSWDFGNGRTSHEKNPVARFDTAGTYQVTLTINKGLWCEHSYSRQVRVDVLPGVLNSFFTAQPQSSCTPGIITLTNQSSNDQERNWYYNGALRDTVNIITDTFNTDTVIDVMLVVYNPSTCRATDTSTLTINIRNATRSAFDIVRDSCSSQVFFINRSDADNGEPLSYTWDFGDGNSSTLKDPVHIYAQDSVYTITLITNAGTFCADTSQAVLSYNDSAHVLTADFILNDSALCIPGYLTATNISINAASVRWLLNNVQVSSDSIFRDTLRAPGTYTLTLITGNPAACVKTDTFTRTLVVSPSGTPDFGIARDSCSLEVQFINRSAIPGGASATYYWEFGDGDTSSEASPKHAYKGTDVYTIKLVANPGSACSDTAVKLFLIDGDTTREIIIPNVFTPNGDGLNDCYRVTGISPKCDEYKVTIYNRWGEVYFRSTDPSVCWNGKNESGTEASVGVYYYIMSIRKRGEEWKERHGTITLIRD
jgi:gliding motility-associated-like protein